MGILINPVVRWTVHPADVGRIDYIDGLWDPSHTLPHEGDIITRPFLVDPVTKLPIPVRVIEIRELPEMQPHTLAVLVTRSDQNH
jgi:hypothetical protein